MSPANSSPISSTTSVLTSADRWDHIQVRWGVRRSEHRVEPGVVGQGVDRLRAAGGFGCAEEESHVEIGVGGRGHGDGAGDGVRVRSAGVDEARDGGVHEDVGGGDDRVLAQVDPVGGAPRQGVEVGEG